MAMGVTSSIVIWSLFFLGIMKTTSSDLVYDFELEGSNTSPSEISTSSGSLQLNTNQYKHGAKSLEWQWIEGSTLTWDLTSKNIAGEKARRGGIKIWIKNENKYPGKCLSFCFSQIKQATGKSGCPTLTDNQPKDSCFPFSLNFKGWRAAWVPYGEFNGCPSPLPQGSRPPVPVIHGERCYDWKITKLVVTISAGMTTPGPLYFDFFRFVDNLSQYRSTRDATVPPLAFKDSTGKTTCTSCNKIYDTNNGLTEADVLARHSRVSHWHQIYRWSLKKSSLPIATTVDTTKLEHINWITRRLINWYANEDTLFLNKVKSKTYFLKKRWGRLLNVIRRADATHGKLKTQGLFSAISGVSGSNNKFSWVSEYVLLPFALRYFIKSRPREVNKMACKQAKTKINCPAASPAISIPLRSCKGKTVEAADLKNCKASLIKTNDDYKKKIIQLFDYLNDQGLQAGSGLGTIDFQGLGMSSFMHSAFLMRKELEEEKKLNDVIAAMKWYNYFGEVYQTTFEYKGSSADVVRTEMLFRLLTVLAMPQKDDAQKKEKIRDMDALKLWLENALTINEGLAGFVKPDFTTFHHKSFYGSAYSPTGLHIASLVNYLLQGTKFELKKQIKTNLVKALEVFRTTAVHYSTPSQIGGRFPTYNGAILAQNVAAYAYLAATPPNSANKILEDTKLNIDSGIVEMFLRLYKHTADTCDGSLNGRLCHANVVGIYYLNTLGSLEIMDKVKTLATSPTYKAESSPSGHWFKPFAALSIHRRNNWAVTVKGFNKYVWDYEHGNNENLYGMFTSHGSMLIANSESALSSKNVDEGWDWRKIPGTTAINLDYSKMEHESKYHRKYNNKRDNKDNLWDTMAGGVSLIGSESNAKQNGVFGMSLIQPSYAPTSSIDFRFKKSVFFYDDMIVSLGSDIKCTGNNKEVYTTLFQDQMKATPFYEDKISRSTTPKVSFFRCNLAKSASDYTKDSWENMASVVLVDVHGNRYYIPTPDKQGLVFTRKKVQESVKSKGKNNPSTGTYCTAWFNHGVNPAGTKKEYDYLVQVDAEPSSGTRKPDFTQNSKAIYKVVRKNNNAHVVKFRSKGNRGSVYGYVVFALNTKVNFVKGPLKSIDEQSIIMVEKQSESLFISVAHPDLMLKKVAGSPSWCKDKYGDTTPIEFDDAGKVLRFCSKSTARTIPVELRHSWQKLSSLRVQGENKLKAKDKYLTANNKLLQFTKLRNGDVTEVKYEKQ